MKEKTLQINWDILGASTSLICAIHCAILPVILTISTLGGLAWLESPYVEYFFLISSFIIASYSLTRDFIKHHHIFHAILVVIFGFSLILSSQFIESMEPILMAAGGLSVAAAHLINLRLTKSCKSCCEHTGH